ncbi:PLC-like phosphodiesterase [Marasmius fiardii PR-910]|nr:PLC-like phosphodiesterase [Marasmius fiardii PR-910]
MVSSIFKFVLVLSAQSAVWARPAQRSNKQTPFDIQGHRGGRGETVENTLPSFAWGLIDGVETLEMDNGITKDGVVIVWHDENIDGTKCKDTKPAFKNDPQFPYVGKFVANLTLAQIKTLDCGSERQIGFPLQTTYPGTKLSTLEELFAFVDCVDPKHTVSLNIESKVNPIMINQTRSPEDFVRLQHELFKKSPYYHKITYQSFDWRTLVSMKALDPSIPTAALADGTTILGPNNTTSPWLAGIKLDPSSQVPLGVQLADAANQIKADILSPTDIANATAPDPTQPGFVPFTTKEMIDRAHEHRMTVKTWTVDRWNVAEQLLDWGVDGIITDFPNQLRRIVVKKGFQVTSVKFDEASVLKCLDEHRQTV